MSIFDESKSTGEIYYQALCQKQSKSRVWGREGDEGEADKGAMRGHLELLRSSRRYEPNDPSGLCRRENALVLRAVCMQL
jgi:hypothetical protein